MPKVDNGFPLMLCLLAPLLWFLGCAKSEELSPLKLNAVIRYHNTQFTISNFDNFEWKDVRMELNGQYLYKDIIIGSGAICKVYASQFVKPDGTPFDTLAAQPEKLSIFCTIPQGRRGRYYVEWEIRSYGR